LSYSFVIASGAAAINLWYLENATQGVLGQFAKRSLDQRSEDIPLTKYLKTLLKRWPADEAQTEQQRVANATVSLLPLIPLMQSIFNTTLEETLYSVWPNPFLNSTPAMENVEDLLLVDGSEILQEIPIWPLIVPARRPDFIIANDAGGTELSNGWMNGSSLVDTAAYAAANNVPFPKVPDQATFINYNFTLYPTFFGCNDSVDVPLVLYAADAPWSAYTNETFLQSNYDTTQLNAIFNNTFNLYSYGNNTVDKEWSGCLACAFMLRSLQRMGMAVPEFCNGCWERHCWNGTYNSTLPNNFFQPSLVLNSSITYSEFSNSPEGAGNSTSTTSSSTNTSVSGTGAGGPSSSATGTKSGSSKMGIDFGLVIALLMAMPMLLYS
jgi:lysophospholipase